MSDDRGSLRGRRAAAAMTGILALAIWAAPGRAPAAEPKGKAKAAKADKQPEKATPKRVAVLHNFSTWRALHSLGAVRVRTDEGLKELRGKKKFDFMTVLPPGGWMKPDFDDAGWPRRRFGKYYNGELDVRAGGGAPCLNVRQVTLRGKFTVTDPDSADDVTLTLLFRGGAAVYVNGREIARSHLAQDAQAGDPAEIYPEKVYLKSDGKPWNWWHDRDTIAKECYPLRVRRIEDLPVPGKLLRKGANVLAVEIHAAPYPAAFAKPKGKPQWCSAGLCEVRLMTSRPKAVAPNVVRPKGLQVWNANLAEEIHPDSYGDPHEPLKPIHLATARNGTAAGRVVLSSDGAIKGLNASLSRLAGANGRKLPASAAEVRYGKLVSLNGSAVRDDAMLEAPPAAIAPPPLPKRDRWTAGRQKARTDDGLPPETTPGAIQSVLVVVEVPPDAAPGRYAGTLRLTAEGAEAVTVPVELDVEGWRVPDPADFQYWFGLVQSPEGVALRYDVEPLSAEHVKLLERSFALIARTGGKVLFLHLTSETEYGNERSMVLWQKGADGKLTPDFSGLKRYVKAAVKHFKPTFVPVCVWQWPDSGKAPLISVLDASTGKVSNVPGPVNGTEEALAFWRPVLTGVKAILDDAGIGDRMLLATGSDRYPRKETVTVFRKILPNVGWEAHRHPPIRGQWMPAEEGRVPLRYVASVWGQWSNWDPDDRRVYGWKYTWGDAGTWWCWLDRGTYDPAGFTRFRTMCEQILLANRRGLGQIGADFWPAPSEKGKYRRGTLYSRFPRSANVGGGNKGCTTNQLFYPGPDGPVPTIRYQLIRENIQECEARIFLERLLTAEPCPLPKDLAARCQAVLDERTRWHRIGYSLSTRDVNAFWPYSGWAERASRLYGAAAEAAEAEKAAAKTRPAGGGKDSPRAAR